MLEVQLEVRRCCGKGTFYQGRVGMAAIARACLRAGSAMPGGLLHNLLLESRAAEVRPAEYNGRAGSERERHNRTSESVVLAYAIPGVLPTPKVFIIHLRRISILSNDHA
jgi:hypothetical protein